MKKIGIIGAMEVEVNFLRSLMGQNVKKTEAASVTFEEGKIHGVDVVLSRSGVGKVNAALCVQMLVDKFGVDKIINTGIAGAAGKALPDAAGRRPQLRRGWRRRSRAKSRRRAHLAPVTRAVCVDGRRYRSFQGKGARRRGDKMARHNQGIPRRDVHTRTRDGDDV